MASSDQKEVVLLAIFPDKTTGIPTVSLVTNEGSFTDSMEKLNDKIKQKHLLQCEQLTESKEEGYCYVLYTFGEDKPKSQ